MTLEQDLAKHAEWTRRATFAILIIMFVVGAIAGFGLQRIQRAAIEGDTRTSRIVCQAFTEMSVPRPPDCASVAEPDD